MKFCDRPFNSIYCAPDGEVWPCGWMHYVIGNLYEQEVDEIWNGEAVKKARETILDGSFAFCRKMSCPFCERGELPDFSEEECKNIVASQTPEYITIANDRSCNIACTTCRTSVYCPEKGERKKIDDALNKLLPFAQKADILDMNGQGEFLSNPSFIRFLERLRPEKENFQIHFETNAILFDEARWSHFSHLGDYHVKLVITVNSLRQEVYRYLSGGFDHLNRVIDNLHFLSDLRREGKIDELNVTMVVQDSNFWEVPDYIKTFAHSNEFEIDQIVMKPLYKWFHMERETYWFKNILDPLHPYHKAYLEILADDCWKDPKVYDWGCHNIRLPQPHPLSQEKIFNRLLLEIYENPQGLSPVEYMKACLSRIEGHRIVIYGENDFSHVIVRLLREAGAEIPFRITRYDDCPGDPPSISMPRFQRDAVDAVLLLEFYDKQNRINNLRSLHYQGPILTLADLIEDEESDV